MFFWLDQDMWGVGWGISHGANSVPTLSHVQSRVETSEEHQTRIHSREYQETETELKLIRIQNDKIQTLIAEHNRMVTKMKEQVQALIDEHNQKVIQITPKVDSLEPCNVQLCFNSKCLKYHSPRQEHEKKEYWHKQKQESERMAELALYAKIRPQFDVVLQETLEPLLRERGVLQIVSHYVYTTIGNVLSSPNGFGFRYTRDTLVGIQKINLFYFHKNCGLCGQCFSRHDVVCGFRIYFDLRPIPRQHVNYRGFINNYFYKLHQSCAKLLELNNPNTRAKYKLIPGSRAQSPIASNLDRHARCTVDLGCRNKRKICYHRLDKRYNAYAFLHYFDGGDD